ncbi:MAG: GntR family transcriptional regulator [Anaerolineae bacterium]
MNSPKPIYEQIKEYILLQIQSGEYVQGDRIPSERTLSDALGVNRQTVKKALDELVHAGHLSVQIGKGTYVNQRRFDMQLETLTSFTEEMARRGKRASSRVLSAGVSPASPGEAHLLQMLTGAPIANIVRLRLADDTPMAIERTQLVEMHCPGILNGHDFSTDSLYDVLLRQYGVQLVRAEQTIGARRATAEESNLLDVLPEDPILEITRITYNTNGQRVEFTRSAYAGARYLLQAVLKSARF